jgi:hypothetical protein
MSRPTSRYDSELQMFAEQPRDADLAHLRFLRWLGEHGRLEHTPAGPPTGLYACQPLASAGDTWCPTRQLVNPPLGAAAPDARRLKL